MTGGESCAQQTWIGVRLGSKVSVAGSMLTGDCRRPLLHIVHAGLIRPQYAGNQLILILSLNSFYGLDHQ